MASTNAWMVVPGPLTSPVGLAEVMRILRLGPPRFRPFALPGPLRLLRLLIALSTPSQRCQCSRKTKSRAWDLSPANTGDAPSCPAFVSSVLDLKNLPGALITPGQRVRDAAQQTFVLDLLPVSLPLRLPGLLFGLAGPFLLCCLLFGGCLPLLRPAFLFLGLIAGQGAPGFFCLAFGLVFHSYSFLSPALQRSQLLDTPFSPGTLHLGEVHTHLLSFLLSRLRGVRLLLASATLVLAFALLASFFLLS